MHSQELNRNCWLITTTVGRWLTEQNKLTRAFHQTAVETIQMCTDAPIEAFLIEFEGKYPALFDGYGRRYIKDKAKGFLSVEFVELSNSPRFSLSYTKNLTSAFSKVACRPIG
jgi:hypothetical protein